MARVTVTPSTFTVVNYDAAHLADLTAGIADAIGLDADIDVFVEVDEGSPLAQARLTGLSPLTVSIHGGALEDPKSPRSMSDAVSTDVLGRLLYRARDRADPNFGDAPDEASLTLPQLVAWEAAALGRLSRRGYGVRRSRRQYHFRTRHGFTDRADNVFERLWDTDTLTWSDIEAACAETARARPVANSR